jgi:two-component system, OmpR family, phosphate regulon sensor histidine kinase PhoR
METGEIKMNFQEFDIVEVSREALEQFEDKAEKKNIQLTIRGDASDKITVYGDSRRMYQVMTNLISNAIKYSQPDGDVEVFFKDGNQDVKISVRDTGIGIPAQEIKRIFERFYRVDKSRSKDKGGAGLGLAIVKHILEAHHTKVTVHSTLGEGSVFSFKLQKKATAVALS